MPPLAPALVRRREPVVGPLATPAMRNVRPILPVPVERVPDPPRRGFDTPARPARMPIQVSLAIAPYKAVMRDEFWITVVAPSRAAAVPGFGMAPQAERVNVTRRPAQAYGDLYTLDPPNG